MGEARLVKWLQSQKCRISHVTATTAIEAAKSQHTTLPGQRISADIVGRLAREVIALEQRIRDVDLQIMQRMESSRAAELLQSLPGFGPLLTAEFLASTGDNLALFQSADRLAGVAGLAPAPRDSGKISGNHHRPRRYDRRLLRACFLSAMISVQHDPSSRTFYDRKRAEGKAHASAVLALARRRLNVIWAMFRDDELYRPPAGPTAPPVLLAA